MASEWTKLRHFDGSQENAFEEVVCQLARAEQIPDRVSFDRIGEQDAGVEAIATLAGGLQYGWQAKFFIVSPTSAQWQQIDRSVRTAIKKRKDLTRYYVCVAFNRADARVVGKKSAKDKWDGYVEKWKKAARERENGKGQEIEFILWDSSEIWDRLSRDEHAGRRYFWFNEKEFTQEWFKNHSSASIANLGDRFNRKLHVVLPIEHSIKWASGGSDVLQILKERSAALGSSARDIRSSFANSKYSVSLPDDALTNIEDSTKLVALLINLLVTGDSDRSELDRLTSTASELQDALDQVLRLLYDDKFALDDALAGISKEDRQQNENKLIEVKQLIEQVSSTKDLLEKHITAINRGDYQLLLQPYLMIKGEAGTGKSHLLAKATKERTDAGKPAILLLGQHFASYDDLWQRIKAKLDVDCTTEELLGALDTNSQLLNERTLILIDAVNESDHFLWSEQVSGFIEQLKRFPGIGLVVSLRKGFETKHIPAPIQDRFVEVEHYGFRGFESEALQEFSKFYRVLVPRSPLLHSEFSLPLFLKILCETIRRYGDKNVSLGSAGLSTILDRYMQQINARVSAGLDLIEGLNIVQFAITKLAVSAFRNNLYSIPMKSAYDLVSSIRGLSTESTHLVLQKLVSEGLITRAISTGHGGTHEEITITYQRIFDHQVSIHLLSEDGSDDLRRLLGGVARDPSAGTDVERSVVEALALQAQERGGTELFDMVKGIRDTRIVAVSVINSLMWRRNSDIGDAVKKYIESLVPISNEYSKLLFEQLLSLSVDVNHPLNSDYLHEYLAKQSMAERDAWWSQYIHSQYGGFSDIDNPSSVVRVIDWARNTENLARDVSDDSTRLLGQILLWLTSSSNRTLRDTATKALVRLLQGNFVTLGTLIGKFADVNDRYVLQRLYCVAYGCVLRSEDKEGIKNICELVYRHVFSGDQVIADILIRDYARRTIEYGLHLGIDFKFDVTEASPPYKSVPLPMFPDKSETERYKTKGTSGANNILSSMKGGLPPYGNFGQYTFSYAFHDRNVDLEGLRNLAITKIFEEYGYNEQHDCFDRGIPYNYRSQKRRKREERIGKKYQWLALHELLARVADHYEVTVGPYVDATPTEMRARDIDPTFISTPPDEKREWIAITYGRKDEMPNEEWLLSKRDFPKSSGMITFEDGKGGEWLSLNSQFTAQYDCDGRTRQVWCRARAYLVSKKDCKKVVTWLKGKSFDGNWMPKPMETHSTFQREYYWSERHSDQHYCDYGHGENKAWIELRTDDYRGALKSREKTRKIADVALASNWYCWDKEGDGTISDNPLSIVMPTRAIYDLLNLKHSNSSNTELLDQRGEMVCFDSLDTNPHVLAIRKQVLLDKLQENDLELFWAVHGEKLVLPESKPMYGPMIISGVAYTSKGRVCYSDLHYKDETGIKDQTSDQEG